ncbi:MAG: hypothetical protein ACLQVI_06845 [Polyangiaceae bacterium]
MLAASCCFAQEAWGQACCAGAGALTPGRLQLHEDALVGAQLHAGMVLGSFDSLGQYASTGPHYGEDDYEEDIFGAVRVLRRGQVALLVPIIETYRTSSGYDELGGGIGDINLSARYDFVRAGESKYVPGIALLAGVTAPTGTPPDAPDPSKPLGTNATGIGAWQGNVGLALEQTYGPWLFNATELLAWRAERTANIGGVSESETLAPQLVTLIGGAYTFGNDASLALFGSYTLEGTASLNGAPAPDSARQIALISVSGSYPVSDHFRVQAGIFVNPPVSGLGLNQTAALGLTLTLLWGWS